MTWALPAALADALPLEASQIEDTRRRLLDCLRASGYQLVLPPMVEYLDALRMEIGSSGANEMDLRMFQLVDQISGRLLGLRADITPQVARIDAHRLAADGVTRLAYCGSVLHTRPADDWSTREPLQLGAELYGHAGVEADAEVIGLLAALLSEVKWEGVRLELGHIGVFRALVETAQLDDTQAQMILNLIRVRDNPELARLLRGLFGIGDTGGDSVDDTLFGIASDEYPLPAAFLALSELNGSPSEILERAHQRLPHTPALLRALRDLSALLDLLARQGMAREDLRLDLAELSAYQYHNGVVFAAYAPGWSRAVARGGRYDGMGKAFGRDRPATGFSLDLREWCANERPGHRHFAQTVLPKAILIPWYTDQELPIQKKNERDVLIYDLRAKGEVLLQELPGHAISSWRDLCDRRLQYMDGTWQVSKWDK